jgi:peptidoglycan/LPS O-acetylase OafA/YrhL
MSPIRYRPEIDGLRAIAVIAVMLFHFNTGMFPGGYLGVDVFFVISGYLITGLIKKDLDNGQFSFTNFYLRRIKRIIPALYILLLLITILAAILLLPTDFKDYGRSLLSQSAFSSNIYFYLKSDYFDTPSLLKPILHTWSLSVEEQFYIIYPLLLAGLFKGLKKNTGFALLLIAIFVISTCYFYYPKNQSAVFFLSPFRSWELLLGAILSCNFSTARITNKPLLEIISWFGLATILYSIIFFSKTSPMHGISALAPTLGTAFIILGNSNSITSVGRLLSVKPVSYTGKISYSLYLYHWPIIVFYTYVIGNNITLTVGLCIFAVSYLCAFLSYRYIETPFRYKPVFRKPASYFAFAFAGALFFLVIGYSINRRNGFPTRFSPRIVRLLTEAEKRPGCSPRVLYKRHQMQYINRCDIDTASKPGILVWGDSHSGMLQPVLKLLSDRYKEKFALYSCPSALNVFIAYTDPSYQQSSCYNSNQEIINYIKSNNIKCILFASFWSQYTENRELKMEGAGEQDKLYADSLTTNFSTADSKRVFKSKFTYTVNLLTHLNVDIWIMEQVPQHEFWAPNEIAKRLIYRQDTTKIGRNLTDHLQRQYFVNSVFATLAQNKHVHILDPTPYFLKGNNFLTVYKNGKSLYKDYNHLSVAGADLLEPMLASMFESLQHPQAKQ